MDSSTNDCLKLHSGGKGREVASHYLSLSKLDKTGCMVNTCV